MKIKRIFITPGEPAGIGPDIVIRIAQNKWPAELIVVADPVLLYERAKQLDLPFHMAEFDSKEMAHPHLPHHIKILPVHASEPIETGLLNPANANYVIETLAIATSQCLKHKASALVTGPVQKSVINDAGIAFTGHTEFFADYCGVAQTVMLFVVDQLKVALATTHLPLADVASAINKESLLQTLSVFIKELRTRFRIKSPRILVCGLNPHAGEGGYLGREEIDIITPVLDQLRLKKHNIVGPLPADTLFTPKYLEKADAVLAMFHDQALPLVKYIGFGRAANVTLGLPFLRTSVDHGTALELAGTDAVDTGSMRAALQLAIDLG